MTTQSPPTELSGQLVRNELSARLVPFMMLAYGFSWLCFLAYVLPNWGNLSTEQAFPYLLVGQFGPSIAALIMAAREGGRVGVLQLVRRLLIVRFSWHWWAIATWLIGVTMVLCGLVAVLVGEPGALLAWLGDKWLIVLLPLIGLFVALGGAGPLGEELGWRGYLQPLLSSSFNPLVSSILLGLIWAFWHGPLFLIDDWRNGLSLPLFTLLYPLSLIAVSYGMAILWKRTRGSVLVAILFHGCLNAAASNILPDFINPLLVYACAIGAMVLWAAVTYWVDRRAPSLG
jgi:uncharacterized protein